MKLDAIVICFRKGRKNFRPLSEILSIKVGNVADGYRQSLQRKRGGLISQKRGA